MPPSRIRIDHAPHLMDLVLWDMQLKHTANITDDSVEAAAHLSHTGVLVDVNPTKNLPKMGQKSETNGPTK